MAELLVKEARIKLRNANTWIIAAGLNEEGLLEEELRERWSEVADEVDQALTTWLECNE